MVFAAYKKTFPTKRSHAKTSNRQQNEYWIKAKTFHLFCVLFIRLTCGKQFHMFSQSFAQIRKWKWNRCHVFSEMKLSLCKNSNFSRNANKSGSMNQMIYFVCLLLLACYLFYHIIYKTHDIKSFNILDFWIYSSGNLKKKVKVKHNFNWYMLTQLPMQINGSLNLQWKWKRVIWVGPFN